jgi:hypothetical protein
LVTFFDADVGEKLLSENTSGDVDSSFAVALDAAGVSLGEDVLIDDSVNGRSLLGDEVETVVLRLVVSGFLEGGSECLSHVGVLLVVEDHVEDLLVTLTPQGSEQDHHGDVFSDLRNSRVDLASSFSLLNIYLELKGGLIGLFILRAHLGIPAVAGGGEFVVEDEDDVAGLFLLSHDDLLRAIHDEVAALVVHAFFVADNGLVIAVVEVALTGPDHDWDLAEFNPLNGVSLDEVGGEVADSLAFLNVDVDLGVDLVGEHSNSCLVREVRVQTIPLSVSEHGFGSGVDLAEDDLVADLVSVLVDFARDVLFVLGDVVVLVLVDLEG